MERCGNPADDDSAGDGPRMRAHCRHAATVVTISGDVDAANIDCASDFATRYVAVGNAVIIDLSGVTLFAAPSISMLFAVDEACATAGVQWALVPGRAVSRVMRLTDCDAALPTASSLPEAERQLGDLTRARRRLALAVTTAPRRAISGSRPGNLG